LSEQGASAGAQSPVLQLPEARAALRRFSGKTRSPRAGRGWDGQLPPLPSSGVRHSAWFVVLKDLAYKNIVGAKKKMCDGFLEAAGLGQRCHVAQGLAGQGGLSESARRGLCEPG